MKVLMIVALLLAVATAAFALGRTTKDSDRPDAPTKMDGRDITARIDDQFRIPAIALLCNVGVELYGPERYRPALRCGHTGRRPSYSYEVVIARDRTRVVRLGYPGDQKVFLERP